MALQQQTPQHAPYAPQTAILGDVPTIKVDVPILAVFLTLYVLGAIVHMTIAQMNRKRNHKFPISFVLCGFCMSRLVTCILRLAWSTRPQHIPLAIASEIFVSIGVILLFIVNIIFAQRILRAQHPELGWHRITTMVFMGIYALILLNLVMLITCTVQSFYTLSSNTQRIDHDIVLYGVSHVAAISVLPISIVVLSSLIPSKSSLDNFGSGRFRTKILVLVTASALLCLGAPFRAGTNYLKPRPNTNPGWYQSKACFYLFIFTVEIVVIVLYALLRVDQRFHVPDGAEGPGSYSTTKHAGAAGALSKNRKCLQRRGKEVEQQEEDTEMWAAQSI